MKGQTVRFILILIIGSILLLTAALKQEGVYAQNSTGTTTNATVLSDDDNNGINSQSRLQSKSVNYYDDSSGYLVFPTTVTSEQQQKQKLPAVVMIHEWWGVNDNIKNMANTLAKEGYVVLAADLYKGEVATDPNRAQELLQSVRSNQDEAIANLQYAVKYLSSLPNANASRIASLGWCFGGGQSLQLALNSKQQPLAATILYYGTPLVTDKQALSNIKWPILGIFGDQDQAIPVEEVKQFETALNADRIPNEIHIYPGVGHAFANPSGDNYAPKETADAWQKTLAFLNRYV
jgi:carboxymethylenebutenolidase